MPRLPAAPPTTRIFARIDRFEVECPACTQIIVAGMAGRAHVRQRAGTHPERTTNRSKRESRKAGKVEVYNPVTATLKCPHCKHSYQVGLILWPLSMSTRGWDVPSDQKPTVLQRAQLRQYAKGFIAHDAKRRGDAVNVYVTEECLCPKEVGGWTPACPLHGWDQVQAAQEAINHAHKEPEE